MNLVTLIVTISIGTGPSMMCCLNVLQVHNVFGAVLQPPCICAFTECPTPQESSFSLLHDQTIKSQYRPGSILKYKCSDKVDGHSVYVCSNTTK